MTTRRLFALTLFISLGLTSITRAELPESSLHARLRRLEQKVETLVELQGENIDHAERTHNDLVGLRHELTELQRFVADESAARQKLAERVERSQVAAAPKSPPPRLPFPPHPTDTAFDARVQLASHQVRSASLSGSWQLDPGQYFVLVESGDTLTVRSAAGRGIAAAQGTLTRQTDGSFAGTVTAQLTNFPTGRSYAVAVRCESINPSLLAVHLQFPSRHALNRTATPQPQSWVLLRSE